MVKVQLSSEFSPWTFLLLICTSGRPIGVVVCAGSRGQFSFPDQIVVLCCFLGQQNFLSHGPSPLRGLNKTDEFSGKSIEMLWVQACHREGEGEGGNNTPSRFYVTERGLLARKLPVPMFGYLCSSPQKCRLLNHKRNTKTKAKKRGLFDKASDFGSGDWGLEFLRG